ncbi:hypothetical protein [Kiloniella sp. EL199]|uniref:hypothetical protein n=1 Tax=Kiloniella sp. EL199 TaxID=2107581 RepID=UPI0013C4D0B4|nr:hypothetical protein [Kiloniella sp. EL199]
MSDTLETYNNSTYSGSSSRNSRVFITTSVDKLYRSEAFQQGYEDYRRGLPFDYPKRCKGPNPSLKSAELAYETGRQFAAWLGPNFYRSNLICLRSKFSEAIKSRSIIL